MRITVTGGTGFIGRRLIPCLLADGHSVKLLARRARTGFGPGVECFLWNAYNLAPPPQSLSDADVVLHLAGEPVSQRWTPSARRLILDSRIKGTRRLVEAMAHQTRKPSVLVCASATGLYGDRGDDVLTESSAPGEGFLAEVCREWETAAGAAAGLGIRVVNLRMGVVLGKEGGALAQMLTPFGWGLGGKVASGRQWMSWIHVEDLVSLILFAITRSALGGPLNAVAENPVTNAEFTRTLATVLRRAAVLTVPAWAVRLIYGEMAEIVLGSQRVRPGAALAAGFEFRFPSLRMALQDLLA